MVARILALAALLGGLAGCTNDTVEPAFPEDYRDTYVEVRDCRQSGDHDLHTVRVLADPATAAVYADRGGPFPVGGIVLKEEYDFGDTDCTGPIVAWTVMQKLEVGTSPADLDWYWQTVSPDREVIEDNPERCANCHQGCVEPEGYDGTCTVP